MKLKILIILIPWLLFSCSSSKKLAEKELEKPQWLQSKPQADGYYVGIGTARKIGTIDEYTNEARKNALADIAGEISTNISSVSVLNQVEDKKGISEIFQNTIKTSSKDFLVAYEKIDAYENQDYYWVYYRLSKETYAIEKEKRKMQAISNALIKYNLALESFQGNQFDFAIKQYVHAIELLKEYLGEETPVTIENKRIDLLSQINKDLSNLFNNITIYHPQKNITVHRGKGLNNHELDFTIVDQNNIPLNGIPVKFSYTGGYLLNDKGISDTHGFISASIHKVNSTNAIEDFIVEIDIQTIASQATKELLIRKLITNYKVNRYELKLQIEQPTVYVYNFEENDSKTPDLGIFFNQVNAILIEKKFQQAILPQNADYVIILDTYTEKMGKTNGLYKVNLRARIDFQDKSKTTIFSGDLSKEVTSLGGYSKAIEEAYIQNKSEFKRKLIDPIIKHLEN